jgi:hypothetical protein
MNGQEPELLGWMREACFLLRLVRQDRTHGKRIEALLERAARLHGSFKEGAADDPPHR